MHTQLENANTWARPDRKIGYCANRTATQIASAMNRGVTKASTIAALDVDYRDDDVATACVLFEMWDDSKPVSCFVDRSTTPAAAYVSGRFFERELPYLEAALARLTSLPEIVIVDGHVWLAGDDPGLGAHLHHALDGRAVVVGVAKGTFHGATRAIDIVRGKSAQVLSVTAIGMPVDEAAAQVRKMHGPHRIPTLLKRADRLCRDA